ncbi:MAG: hypothetical protein ACE5H2_03855 [Terriglobia bacterium]
MLRQGRWLLLPALLALALLAPAQPAANSRPGRLTAREIITRLQERNRVREALLEAYSVRRFYRVANELFGKRSEIEVEMVFHSPDQLAFRIRRQSGSGFLARRVLRRLMAAEKDALTPENKRRSALTKENYEFTLLGQELLDKRWCYVLGVKPKRRDTYLMEGRIWIDAEDFATVRAAGKPSKRPSFWTRKIEFVRGYRKVGPFWLPDRVESVTEVLLFGQSTLAMESGDYRIRLRPPAPQPPSNNFLPWPLGLRHNRSIL